MEKVSLDLLKGDQFAADYQKLNPEGVVPTLIDGEGPAAGSVARDPGISRREISAAAAAAERLARAGACARDRPDGRDGRASVHRAARAQISRGGTASRRSGARQMGAPLARCRQPRGRGGAGADPRTGKFCVGDQVDRRGHLSGRAPDQRQTVRRARSRAIIRPRAASTPTACRSRRSRPSIRCASPTRRRLNSDPTREETKVTCAPRSLSPPAFWCC